MGSSVKRRVRGVASSSAQAPLNSPSDQAPPPSSDAMRRVLRYGVPTVVLVVLTVVVAFALPSVKSSGLWNDSLDTHAQLKSAKTALHAARRQARGNGPTVEVLAAYPHDANAFTQGLLFAQQGREKFFIESTGLYGESTLRKVEITTGKVLAKYDFDSSIFGEGVTLGHDGELVMITWKEKLGYTFDLASSQVAQGAAFKVKSTFSFETVSSEGWGIDYDGKDLVVSDGSSKIQFWDPKTKTRVREITVSFKGQEIPHINELEVANGFIYANIWFQTVIVKIDPADGKILTVFDCGDLMAESGATPGDTNAVLNGIAYDGDEDVFYITGKLWGRVFKVRLLD